MAAGETEEKPSAWTIDTVLAHLDRINQEMDRRYEQRFLAQQNAVDLALSRVDKEFHEHLQQVREETRLSLDAADKAIAKSEAATEKRFESVNEFRGQLQDQATRFMPRLEAEQRIEQNTEKLAALDGRHTSDVAEIRSRLDLTAGRGLGIEKGWGILVGLAGLVGGVIAVVISLTSQ